MSTLHYRTATSLASDIRTKTLKVSEVLEAHLARIEDVNPELNAIVTLDKEAARQQAAEMDANFSPENKPLYGIPIAVKDLAMTKGMRTTFGSPIYESNIPEEDELFVARLRRAGAIIIGKTNTPEFGAGSQTFNKVFGATKNPYDTSKTCGGSSGGAAVALASGMLPIADGSDLGGSLRNPAAFCNVVGFRPSPGRVPNWPKQFSSEALSVSGPMARNVPDLALLLSVIAGPDDRVPISLAEPGNVFSQPLERDWKGAKIACSKDLGLFEVEKEISQTFESTFPEFSGLGASLENAFPDLAAAQEVFTTLRAWLFAARFGPLLTKHREQMKDTVIWNIEQGLALTVADLTRAETLRSEIIARMADFFTQYDFLICPTTQALPFSLDKEWIDEINGVALPTYLDWMGICWAITVTGCPAISVPAGFSSTGLPIGLQIIGPRGRDFDVLQLAYAVEKRTKHGTKSPNL